MPSKRGEAEPEAENPRLGLSLKDTYTELAMYQNNFNELNVKGMEVKYSVFIYKSSVSSIQGTKGIILSGYFSP